jgi:hypothetical protein
MTYWPIIAAVAFLLALGSLCAWNLRHDDSLDPPAPRWFA